MKLKTYCLAVKAQGKVQDLRLFFVACSHEPFHINFISRVICFENMHLTFFISGKRMFLPVDCHHGSLSWFQQSNMTSTM